MILKLLAFGVFTDIFKSNTLNLELDSTMTVKQLKKIIIAQYPQSASLNFAVAVDEAYADDDTIIKENQVVALIPPVSGG